jgi:acetylornithine deacetylase
MDVVPVEGQEWTTDPFVLTEKADGKLYGRGSCDMKGFLACCLALLPKMIKTDLRLPIYFAFSYDEEIGCLSAPDLIENIKQTYKEKIKYAIIGEPSMMQPIVGQKGICVIKTTVNGSAGHSSRIRQEVSAIHESARLILWLEGKMNSLVEAGRIDDRFSPPHSSLHIGQINAGIAPNVIADMSVFKWDVRVIPQDDAVDILAEFDIYCREREQILRATFPGFKIINTQYHPPVPPLDTSESDDVVSFIKSLVPIQDLGTVAYAAEAGQFSNGGFQSVICGPGSIAQAHRANEFIAKDQLEKGDMMIKNLINILSKP